MRSGKSDRDVGIGLTIVIWLVTAWLLYPLIVLETVDITNVKSYLYRSAFGITVMIIFFGKTIFDLFFPQARRGNRSLINTIMLSLYGIGLAGGILLMTARIVVLYLKSRKTGFIF